MKQSYAGQLNGTVHCESQDPVQSENSSGSASHLVGPSHFILLSHSHIVLLSHSHFIPPLLPLYTTKPLPLYSEKPFPLLYMH